MGGKQELKYFPPNAHSNDHNGHIIHSAGLAAFDLEFEEKYFTRLWDREVLKSKHTEEPKYCHRWKEAMPLADSP